MAEFLISDGGASGAKGFSIPHANLYQRYRPVFSHSDYFYPLNYRENWIPFLEGGEPAAVPVERARHFNWRFVLTVALAITALTLVAYVAFRGK